MTSFQKALANARRYATEHPDDCHLAIYMVRDYQELRDLGLSDLAWSFHREGYVSPEEAAWFFSKIDEKTAARDAGAQP